SRRAPPASERLAAVDGGAPAPRPAHRSPYDHLLRVRGDVGGTSAIAIFIAGATTFLLAWSFLTAGGPDPREVELTVGADGRVALPAEVGPATPVWIDGHSQAGE